MANVDILVRVLDQASAQLKNITGATDQLERSTSSLERTQRTLNSAASAFVTIGRTIVGALLAGGLVTGLRDAADAAQEAESNLRILQNTARDNGVSFDALQKDIKGATDRLGLLVDQTSGATAQMLRAGFTTEQIRQAFEAGGASALAFGKNAASGVDLVAQALSTGQSVYLNQIGISENIADAMNKAYDANLKYGVAAAEAARNQAGLNIILKATKSEVGSLETLMGGLAGAKNRASQEAYKLKINIGNLVKEGFTIFYDALGKTLARINEFASQAPKYLAGVATAWQTTVGLFTAGSNAIAGAVQGATLLLQGLNQLLVSSLAQVGQYLAKSAELASVIATNPAKALQLYKELIGIIGTFGNTETDKIANSKILQGGQQLYKSFDDAKSIVGTASAAISASFQAGANGYVSGVNTITNATGNLSSALSGGASGGSGKGGGGSTKESLASALEILGSKFKANLLSIDQYKNGLESLIPTLQKQLSGLKEGSQQWQKTIGELTQAKNALDELNKKLADKSLADRLQLQNTLLVNLNREIKLADDAAQAHARLIIQYQKSRQEGEAMKKAADDLALSLANLSVNANWQFLLTGAIANSNKTTRRAQEDPPFAIGGFVDPDAGSRSSGSPLIQQRIFKEFGGEIIGLVRSMKRFIENPPFAIGGFVDPDAGARSGPTPLIQQRTFKTGPSPDLRDPERDASRTQFDALFGYLLNPLGKLNDILERLNPVTALVTGFMERLGPVIDAFLQPLTILGEILAITITPIFQLLQPILKGLALIVGNVVLALGEFWNFLTGWLKYLGINITVDTNAVRDALKRIEESSLDSAKGLERLSNSVNLVSGYGFTGVAMATGGNTNITVNVNGSSNPAEVARKVIEEIDYRNRALFGRPSTLRGY